MSNIRKQMEEGISADEILEALRQVVIDQVVENRARQVESDHYGYLDCGQPTKRQLDEFKEAIIKAFTR